MTIVALPLHLPNLTIVNLNMREAHRNTRVPYLIYMFILHFHRVLLERHA